MTDAAGRARLEGFSLRQQVYHLSDRAYNKWETTLKTEHNAVKKHLPVDQPRQPLNSCLDGLERGPDR